MFLLGAVAKHQSSCPASQQTFKNKFLWKRGLYYLLLYVDEFILQIDNIIFKKRTVQKPKAIKKPKANDPKVTVGTIQQSQPQVPPAEHLHWKPWSTHPPWAARPPGASPGRRSTGAPMIRKRSRNWKKHRPILLFLFMCLLYECICFCLFLFM